MRAVIEVGNHKDASSSFPLDEKTKAEAVLQELDRILASRYFRSAERSRQFLQYVVQHKLAGHVEQLKERTIGTEVFQRAPGYATGEDSVVRVQAGEVRRRLEQYYQTESTNSPVSIKLPVGSYAPIIQWSAGAESTVPAPHLPLLSTPPAQPAERRPIAWLIVAVFLAAAAAFGALFFLRGMHKSTTIEGFWNPVFATQQPVMICLAKPVVYRPSLQLYQRYVDSHPGTFQTEVERYNQPLPLDSNEKLLWKDMTVYPEYGIAVGDAYAGLSLSSLLGKIGKPSQVRIGSNYSFEDLRNSPAVVVGAFNNRWTMQLTSNLHFAFVERNGQFTIREQGSTGRVWNQFSTSAGEPTDFAIVGRLLDSKTGQFTVVVAGIDGTGTQAAAEFVSNAEFMDKGLHGAPSGWQKGNLELVLQTTITDSIAGPPRVVASYYW